MINAGIDAGSRSIKVVIFDSDRSEILATGIADQGIQQNQLARKVYEGALSDAGVTSDGVRRCIATGYGRNLIDFADTTITEITCHATGVRHLYPKVQTIVEIGGQDSKIIKLDSGGKVRDFAMNDRCAAGTGRFLEVVAKRLDLDFESMALLAGRSEHPAQISSMCVVFAETEIVSLLASGTAPEDIIAGVQDSIVRRIVSMAGRSISQQVVFTGGVAMIPSMVRSLEAELGMPVEVPEAPMLTGALGAALMGSLK